MKRLKVDSGYTFAMDDDRNSFKLVAIGVTEDKYQNVNPSRIYIPEIFADYIIKEPIQDTPPVFDAKAKEDKNIDFVGRLINERNSLLENVEKLKVFVTFNPVSNKLSNEERILLLKQLKVMEEYLTILDDRIELISKRIDIDKDSIAKRNLL